MWARGVETDTTTMTLHSDGQQRAILMFCLLWGTVSEGRVRKPQVLKRNNRIGESNRRRPLNSLTPYR